MAVETLLEDRTQAGRRRKLIISIIIGVVVIHIAAGVVAGIFVVARYFTSPPAQFEVMRDIRLPAKEREHKMNMAEFDAQTPKPSFTDKLASLRPTDFSLPDIPQIPADQMLPLDPSEIMTDAVSSLVGTAGLGGGGEGAGGLGGVGDGFSFMGIESNATRILVLYDVSNTTIRKAREAGMPFERIKEETKRLLDSLGINTRFGMAMFARNYAFFKTELLPASDQNRDEAKAWLERYFTDESPMAQSIPGMVRGSPGFRELLRAAFQLNPDVIFVISDGGFYEGAAGDARRIPHRDIGNTMAELQKAAATPVQINFIGAQMDTPDRSGIRGIINRHGGGGRYQDLRRE